MALTYYRTGRTYNGDQILVIDAPQPPSSAFGAFSEVSVAFLDQSRNINGTVRLFTIECDAGRIGRAVLREYDAGRYTLL